MNTSPLNGYVGYALRRAQGVLFADFSDTLAELGLRPAQFAALSLLRQNPGVSQSSVCVALGVQKANFVAIIGKLEKCGLVTRRKSDTDARTYALEITSRGRRTLRRATERLARHEGRITARLGPKGRAHLLELLEKLSELD